MRISDWSSDVCSSDLAYGNWIARTIAADFPELARGVVLVAAGAKSMPRELTDTITMINDPAAPEAERLAGLRPPFFPAGGAPPPGAGAWHPEVIQNGRPRVRQSGCTDG